MFLIGGHGPKLDHFDCRFGSPRRHGVRAHQEKSIDVGRSQAIASDMAVNDSSLRKGTSLAQVKGAFVYCGIGAEGHTSDRAPFANPALVRPKRGLDWPAVRWDKLPHSVSAV
jgi:hypothetical protein